jgi:hypothetical protein
MGIPEILTLLMILLLILLFVTPPVVVFYVIPRFAMRSMSDDSESAAGEGAPEASPAQSEAVSTDLEGIDDSEKSTAGEGTAESSSSQAEIKPTETDELEGMPAVKNWKTSILLSLLGIVGYAISYFLLAIVSGIALEAIYGTNTYEVGVVYGGAASAHGLIASIVMSLLTICYVIGGYSSYFYDKPWLKSNKAISFLNFMFGGIVFGVCWNSNLTKSRKSRKRKTGISGSVAIALSALWICFGIIQLGTSYLPAWSQAKASYESLVQSSAQNQAQNQAQTETQSSENAQSYDKALGSIFSIEFPVEPTYKYSEDGGIPTELYYAKSDDCYVLIQVIRGNIDHEGEESHDFAASATYSFLKSLSKNGDTSFAESDIGKADMSGHPAGYIYFSNQSNDAFYFVSSVVGDNYVVDIYIRANSEEAEHKALDSFTVK